MLLKVLIYAYTQQIYSCRKIAKALRENIYFMWLSGNNHPDFHTINRYRGVILRESIGEIFGAVLRLLEEGGYIKLEKYFVDGTKIEANANKYSFVWAKNTQRYKAQVQEKVTELLEKIDQINAAEDAEYGERDLPERGGSGPLDAARLEEVIQGLNKQLNQSQKGKEEVETGARMEPPQSEVPLTPPPEESSVKEKEKKPSKQKTKEQKIRKMVTQLSEEYLPRMQKYEEQEKILGDRNSYSKIDHDASCR
jgi:hypothetical protein